MSITLKFIKRSTEVILLVVAASTCAQEAKQSLSSNAGEPIGHGDGRIHVIPSLSRPSLKNGEKMTISAVIKAQAGVQKVTADIGGLETVTLKPSTQNLGGVNALGTLGMWSAEWTGHGLEEKYYTVALKVVDKEGHEFEDRSLQFSDPIVGLSTAGNTNYPNVGMKRVGASVASPLSENPKCAAIDLIQGYAFFGTTSTPASVVKVALGAGNSPPRRVASLMLNPGENSLVSAVIDSAAGFAYFGTQTNPGIIVKVALGMGDAPPSRVGALMLNTGENSLRSAVIDTTKGYAYFGADTYPGIVVKVALGAGNALPTRVAALTLNSGEEGLYSAVIDTFQGYAYFGTITTPGLVIKIALGAGSAPPLRIGAVTLNSGENDLYAAAIDTGGGYAYFGTHTNTGIIVKVALGVGNAAPTRVGAVALDIGNGFLTSGVIDAANGYIYFGSEAGFVVKVALGSGASFPTIVGQLKFLDGNLSFSAAIDAAGGYAYYAIHAPGVVIKVALGAGNALPANAGAVILNAGESSLRSAVIDPIAGYAYFGTYTNPGILLKVALNTGNSPPTRVATLTLDEQTEQGLSCAVIDPLNGYAYFGTSAGPGYVEKIALGAGDSPPSRIGRLQINSNLLSAVIDAVRGYAYFGSDSGLVIKVALGAGSTLPTRVGAVKLNAGEDYLFSAVIDTVEGFAYFGTINTVPGTVVKVALGLDDAPPVRVGAVTLNSGENNLCAAVIDPAASYAYFGTDSSPAKVVKIALGAGSAPPVRVGALTLNSGEYAIRSAVIDVSGGCAYFGLDAPKVVKVSLGTSNELPVRLGALNLNPDEDLLRVAVVDAARGYAYFGTYLGPDKIVKVRIGNEQGLIKASRIIIPEEATLTDMHFYSNVASGNVRLGIYDNSLPRKLVWQSESVPNVPNTWHEIVVPIGTGTPSVLSLPSATYWLAWQVDNSATIPGYYQGVPGDGISIEHPIFGVFANTLGTESITDERWTEYLTYYRKPHFELSGATSQNAGAMQTRTITAYDNSHNISTDYSGSKVLRFSGANAAANPTRKPQAGGVDFGLDTTVTFSQGVATIPITLFKAEMANIAVDDIATDVHTPAPFAISVTLGAPDHFLLAGSATQSAGTPQTVAITAQDSLGNTQPSYTGAHLLTFSGANPAADNNPSHAPSVQSVAFGTPVPVSFVNGVATVPMTLYKAETANVGASDGALGTPVPLQVTVTALGIASLSMSGSATQVAGTAQVVTLTALDNYGNISSSFAGLNSVLFFGANKAPNLKSDPKAGGANFGTFVPVTFFNGGATLLLELVTAEQAAVVASTTSALGTFNAGLNVNVIAGPAGALQLIGQASQIENVSQDLVVKAFDNYGNIAAGYAGTVTLTSSDLQAVLPSPYTFTAADMGQEALAVTLKTTGLQSVTASDGTYSASFNITVTPNGGGFVNQAPSFGIPNPALSIRADAGPQNIPGFAINLSSGPASEAAQKLNFLAPNVSNASLFLVLPSISNSGMLTYVPNPNAAGQAAISIALHDDGGTLNGGVDTSAPQSFAITINPAPPVLPDNFTVNGMVGAPFSFQLAASGGRPLSFIAPSESMPPGLSLTGDTISGTPTMAGHFNNVTVTVSNGVLPNDSKTLKMLVIDTINISTFAGKATGAASGDGGPATAAMLNQPLAVAKGPSGHVYIADTLNNRVRKVDPNGTISTYAGGGSELDDGVPALSAQLDSPSALALDGAENLYICETKANRVRRIDLATGKISTVVPAGVLNSPSGLAVDSAGNLFIADKGNRCVRKVDFNGRILVYAGQGTVAGAMADGGLATAAKLGTPFGIATDSAGRLYIADQEDQVVRVVGTTGIISTYAGTFGMSGFSGDGGIATKALLNNPLAVAVDLTGNVYIADSSSNRIRKVLGDGIIVTIGGSAGAGGLSGDGKPALGAQLNGPVGVASGGADDSILVADRFNSRIRRLSRPGNPKFISGPTATSNPTNYKMPVLFAATVESSSPVSWVWDFGDDGDISTASSPTHIFPGHKVYTVTATATDQTGSSVSASVQVDATLLGTIVPAEIMNALELDTYDPAQSPLGADEFGKLSDAGVVKISSLKLNYKIKGKDSLALTASTILKAPPNPNGQTIVLDLGGIVKVFTIAAKGKGYIAANGNPNDRLAVGFKSGVMNIKAQFKNAQFVQTLEKIKGFGENDREKPSLDFNMIYGGQLYRKLNFPVSYKINAKGRTGSGKAP